MTRAECERVADLERELSAKTRALASTQQDLGLAHIAARQAKELLASCEKALTERDARVMELTRALAESEALLARREKDLEDATRQANQALHELSRLSATLHDSESDLRQTRNALRETEKDLHASLQIRTEERKKLEAQLADLERSHAGCAKAMESGRELLEEHRRNWGAEVYALQLGLAAKDAEIERLSREWMLAGQEKDRFENEYLTANERLSACEPVIEAVRLYQRTHSAIDLDEVRTVTLPDKRTT